MHEAVEADRDGRFEADDAERRAVELHHLLVGVVRRVVGGNDVHGAVDDAVEHGVAVGRFPQRRVHATGRVVSDDGCVREQEVMRRDFGGDAEVARFGFANDASGTERGDVRRVVPRAELEQTAREMAETVALVPPLTAEAVKASINHMVDLMGQRESWRYHFMLHQFVSNTPTALDKVEARKAGGMDAVKKEQGK